jgi:hypothetical protein
MLEASEAKELIDEAVERVEAHEAAEASNERTFRERLSLLVGVFAVLLAVIHVVGAGLVRANIVNTIHASDTYAYMQAKKIRQQVLIVGALSAPADKRAELDKQAQALALPDVKGHGIAQLQEQADTYAEAGVRAGEAGERYEWAETALQMAIVLLSIAMIAGSRWIAAGSCVLAGGGVALALATHFHLIG